MTSHGGPPAESDSESHAESQAEPGAAPDPGHRAEPADAARATPPGEKQPNPDEAGDESTVEVPDPDPTVEARAPHPPADPTVELREPRPAADPAVVDLTAAEVPAPPPDVTVQTPAPAPAWARPPSQPPLPPPDPPYVDDLVDEDDVDDEVDDVDEWARARRRHRRQTVTFAGGFAFVLVVGLLAYLTFLGRIPWPFGGKVNAAVSLCAPSKPLPPKTVTLRVYNGSSRKGLATAVTGQLQAFGFVVEDTGNDPLEAKLKTPIQVRHGDTGALAARTVAAYLVGKADDVVDDRQSESVDVVLGATFTRVKTRKEVTASLTALSASLPRTCPPGVTDGASPSATSTGTPRPTGTRTSGPTKRPTAPTTRK